MDQLKINLKDNIHRSKRELAEENAWLHHLIYQVRLLSPIVRDSLVLHATRFISTTQSKPEYEEINELNIQVNTLKELVGDSLVILSLVILSYSFLSWLINKINLQSENTYCLSYLEEYHGDQWNPNLFRRISQKCDSNLPRRLILFLNIYITLKPSLESFMVKIKNDIVHVTIPYLYTIFYPIKHIIVILQGGIYHVNLLIHLEICCLQ